LKIEKTRFGSIVIDGVKYSHDVYITTKREVQKRQKKLSKPISKGHTVLGPKEIKLLLDQKPDILVIGKGQFGVLPIPNESRTLLEKANVEIIEDKTANLLEKVNELLAKKANFTAILHVTC
jgi:hypothetical protein